MDTPTPLLDNYARRYESDAAGENAYRASGKNRLIGTEKWVLTRAMEEVLAHKPASLRMLDFGCGDGRALEGIIELYAAIGGDVPLEIVGYDIIPNGLEALTKRLVARGYTEQGVGIFFHAADNIKISLLLGTVETTPAEFTIMLGVPVHISIAAYGTLCHLLDDVSLPREQQPRVRWMQALGQATTGQVIISLSKPVEYPEDIAATGYIKSHNGKALPPHTFLYADTPDGALRETIPMVTWQCLTVNEALGQAQAAWGDTDISICPSTIQPVGKEGAVHFLDCLRDENIDNGNTETIIDLIRTSSSQELLTITEERAGFIYVIRGKIP